MTVSFGWTFNNLSDKELLLAIYNNTSLTKSSSHMKTPCRIWTRGRTGMGYGSIYYKKKQVYVHRLVFYLIHGYWPLQANHNCDVSLCCNVEDNHVYDGTQQDNMQDKWRRNRQKRGKKLRDHDVLSIQMYAKAGVPKDILAQVYDVSYHSIYSILTKKTWNNI